MKRSVLLIGCAASLLPFACSSNGDSTASTGVDASAGDSSVADGSSADTATNDAAPHDAPTSSPLTITVANKRGTPTVGALVVFQDVAGAVVDTAMTGSDGKVSHAVDAGSQVTVALLGTQTRQLITFVGVEPGDDLKALDATATDDVVATVSVPGSLPAGAVGAYVYGGSTCRGSGALATVGFTVTNECQNGTTFPVLALAHGSNGQTIGFSFKNGNTYSGTTATVSGLPAWTTGLGTFAITTANFPDAGQQRVAFSHVADGVIAYRGLADASPNPRSFETYPGFADVFQAEAQAVTFDNVAFTVQASILAQRMPISATTVSFDMTQRLPDITHATLDTTNAVRPKLSWTSTASLATTDGAGAMLLWDIPVDGSTQLGTWTFIVPPDTTSIQAPAMPASASAWLPEPSTMYGPPSIAFIDAAAIAGYDQVRANAAAMFPILTPRFIWDGSIPVLPVDGLVRASWLMLNGT